MLFSSKRSAEKTKQISDVLSISRNEVKNKLAELADMSKQVECTFREASASCKEVTDKLAHAPKRRKKLVAVAS